MAAGASFVQIALCDEGDLPISGGYVVYAGASPTPGSDPGPMRVWSDRYLVPSATFHGWEIQGRNESDVTQNIRLRILCADISTPLPDIG